MNREELISLWKTEENTGRGMRNAEPHEKITVDSKLPWDYSARVREFLKDGTRVLDMSIGSGGAIMNHPFDLTAAIEDFGDNEVIRKLEPMGLTVRKCEDPGVIPYEDGSFNLVISRNVPYDLREINRVLRKGGHFITQQVGSENMTELLTVLGGILHKNSENYNLENQVMDFQNYGFRVVFRNQDYPILKFDSVSEVCRFAAYSQDDIPDFSVEKYSAGLFELQKLVENRGFFETSGHRFIIVAKKL